MCSGMQSALVSSMPKSIVITRAKHAETGHGRNTWWVYCFRLRNPWSKLRMSQTSGL